MTEPHDLTPPDGGALSHLDDRGRARMVDVSGKADTARVAVAAGELVTTAEVVSLVRADDMPKADVLATARIAGIAAAKRTWELIPLCHQLALSSVKVTFGFTDTAITIEATAKTKGPTGVEMEALTAVAVAGLTLHDMVKAVDPAAVLNGVRLVSKEGGKRGHWQRDEAETAAPAEDETVTPDEDDILEQAGVPATVLVASTGVAAGTREDRTGPLIADFLEARGFTVRGPLVYADADIAWGLEDALAGDPALVISTGGTGASPRTRPRRRRWRCWTASCRGRRGHPPARPAGHPARLAVTRRGRAGGPHGGGQSARLTGWREGRAGGARADSRPPAGPGRRRRRA